MRRLSVGGTPWMMPSVLHQVADLQRWPIKGFIVPGTRLEHQWPIKRMDRAHERDPCLPSES